MPGASVDRLVERKITYEQQSHRVLGNGGGDRRYGANRDELEPVFRTTGSRDED